MQSNANIPFSFAPGTDMAAQNAFMQSLSLAGQTNNNNQGGMVPNNQMLGGFPMLDQNNMQGNQSGFSMNQLNMLLQQSMGQLQGFNVPPNAMGPQMPFQMQQQMMGTSDDPSQMQQMNYGGMNPQALIAQMQSSQYQNAGGISDAMAMALQGILNAQRSQMVAGGRENSNSNNTVVLGGNQRFQPNQSAEGSLRLNTVYVSNLPQNVDHEMIKREFSKVGSIKLNSKSGMPMIWIFKDRGVPRGDALVTYDSNSSASNAVMYFQENDFDGCRIEVRIATNSERPIIAPPNNQNNNNNQNGKNMNMNDKRGNNQYKIESISRQNDFNTNYDWQKKNDDGNRKDFRNKQNDKNRGPDWICVKCNNNNFSWRDTCNRCQGPKGDAGDMQKQDRGRMNMNNNRMNNKTLNRPNNRNQDGGPMRGPKRSNSRPGPY